MEVTSTTQVPIQAAVVATLESVLEGAQTGSVRQTVQSEEGTNTPNATKVGSPGTHGPKKPGRSNDQTRKGSTSVQLGISISFHDVSAPLEFNITIAKMGIAISRVVVGQVRNVTSIVGSMHSMERAHVMLPGLYE